MINYRALKDLSEISPEIFMAEDGLYYPRVQGKPVHSSYSPGKEALRLVNSLFSLDKDKTLIIILGAGFGYHLEILEKEGFQNIIIIELNPNIHIFFQKIYQIPPNYFYISPTDRPDKLDTIFSLIEIQNFKNIKTLILRGAYDKETYTPFEDRIERLLKVKLGDFTTRLNFEEIWFINILKNIPNLKTSYPVSQMDFKKINAPVMVISAGPSLKFSLDNIKRACPYCITISVDTAVLPLFEAGIIPDFIYSLDSQVYNLGDFSLIDSKYISKTNLIYDIVVNTSLPSYFDECNKHENRKKINKYIATTAHLDFDYSGNSFLIKSELVNWIESYGGIRLGDVESGGSVSTSSFHFAYTIGGKEIILVGQDLAYSYKTSHSPSTSHFYRILQKNNRLTPLESVFLKILRSRKYSLTDGTDNNIPVEGGIYTDFVLNNFKGWFEESAKNIHSVNPHLDLVNATKTGAVITNFRHEDLDYYVNEMCKNYPLIDKKKLFDNHLIDFNKIDKIIMGVFRLGGFIRKLKIDPSLFPAIESSEWIFLNRYFMKEKVIYERYEKFDKARIEKKIGRLIKNIEGLKNARG